VDFLPFPASQSKASSFFPNHNMAAVCSTARSCGGGATNLSSKFSEWCQLVQARRILSGLKYSEAAVSESDTLSLGSWPFEALHTVINSTTAYGHVDFVVHIYILQASTCSCLFCNPIKTPRYAISVYLHMSSCISPAVLILAHLRSSSPACLYDLPRRPLITS
jgi:hypothetical protein